MRVSGVRITRPTTPPPLPSVSIEVCLTLDDPRDVDPWDHANRQFNICSLPRIAQALTTFAEELIAAARIVPDGLPHRELDCTGAGTLAPHPLPGLRLQRRSDDRWALLRGPALVAELLLKPLPAGHLLSVESGHASWDDLSWAATTLSQVLHGPVAVEQPRGKGLMQLAREQAAPCIAPFVQMSDPRVQRILPHRFRVWWSAEPSDLYELELTEDHDVVVVGSKLLDPKRLAQAREQVFAFIGPRPQAARERRSAPKRHAAGKRRKEGERHASTSQTDPRGA